MPRLSTIAAAAVFLSGITLAGQAPPAPAQNSAGNAVVAGQVVDAHTGAPVGDTLLGLSRRRASGPNTTPTAPNVPLVTLVADAQGRFVFRDVASGPYLLLATAPGYIVSNYGQGRPAGPTNTLDVADGEWRTNLVVKLWRHAAISGTVSDEAGEPVVGATVRAMKRVANGPGGERRFGPGLQAVETTTDDRGEYRLTLMGPGQYIVTVPQTQVTVPAGVIDRFVQSVAGRGGANAGGRLLDVMSSLSSAPSAGGGIRVDGLLLQSAGSRGLPLVESSARARRAGRLLHGDLLGGIAGSHHASSGRGASGVHIRLRPETSVRVSGTVTVAGAPAPNVVVRLIRTGGPTVANDNGVESAAAVTGADGTFTLLGVTPGPYVLKALRMARPRLPPALAANPALVAAYDTAASGDAQAALVGAQLPLTVGARDLRDVTVALRAGATLGGRVVFEGQPPPSADVQRIAMLLTSEDGGLPGANLQITPVAADGTFSIPSPAPGRYLVTALRLPVGWHSSGLTLAGEPLTGAIDLSGDAVTDLRLTYTTSVAAVTGTLRSANGAVSGAAEVVVLSVDRRHWVLEPLNPRQPRIEQAAGSGTYVVDSLLPGEYLVAAVSNEDVPEIADADFFDAVSRFATRVTLGSGQKASLDLTIRRIR